MRWNVNVTRTTREIPNTLSIGFANSCFLNKNAQRILTWESNHADTHTQELDPQRFTNQTYSNELIFMSWEGDGFNDFVNHLGNMEELKHEKGMVGNLSWN